MPFIPYNENLKQLFRNLRNNSTLSEVLLWNELKARKMRGYRFNRQKPIGNYIADFYSRKLKLIIEIDGISHVGKEFKDIRREIKINDLGLSVLRFDDDEVKLALNVVLSKIEEFIDEFESKSGG